MTLEFLGIVMGGILVRSGAKITILSVMEHIH